MIIYQKFIKFIFSGVLNTLFTYLLYIALIKFIDFQAAYLFAYISGIFISFILNSIFVFGVKIQKRNFSLFFLTHAINYFVSSYLLKLMVIDCGIAAIYAPIIVIGISFILMFFIFNKLLGSYK